MFNTSDTGSRIDEPAQASHALDDVAVMIPAYNCQQSLERTLASLCESAPLKVLVVDDGSQPALIAPELPLLHIEILRLDVNGGVERARRMGCERLLQSGVRFIGLIDAGDLAMPGRFAKQRLYLTEHPAVGVVGAWAKAVSTSGQHLYTVKPPVDATVIRRQRFFRSCFVNTATMLRAEAVALAGNYRDSYPAAEDFDLLLRIMQRHECANLAELGVTYELNERGVSSIRRLKQVISTLKLQLHYFEPFNGFYWLGLLKNCLHLLLPFRALQGIKKAVLSQ